MSHSNGSTKSDKRVTIVGGGLAGMIAAIACAEEGAAVTLLQVRIGLEPLHELRRDIANVRRGDSERLAGDYPAELKPVTQELNALVDHNREVVERAERGPARGYQRYS